MRAGTTVLPSRVCWSVERFLYGRLLAQGTSGKDEPDSTNTSLPSLASESLEVAKIWPPHSESDSAKISLPEGSIGGLSRLSRR